MLTLGMVGQPNVTITTYNTKEEEADIQSKSNSVSHAAKIRFAAAKARLRADGAQEVTFFPV